MALDYDGLNDYVEAPDHASLDITGALTMIAKIKTTSPTLNNEGIISKFYVFGAIHQRSYLLAMKTPGEELLAAISDDGTAAVGHYNQINSVGAINDGAWHTIAGVFIPSTSFTLYIDAVQDGQLLAGVIAALHPGTAPFWLGIFYNVGSADVSFNGIIADARVYARALSLAEIETIHYSQGNDGIVDDLRGRWLQNELTDGSTAAVANSVIDISDYGNHCSPRNGPVYRQEPAKLVRPISTGIKTF